MSRVIICDRCKVVVKRDIDSHTVRVISTVYEKSLSKTNSCFHLCKNCFNDFKKFMNVEIEKPND